VHIRNLERASRTLSLCFRGKDGVLFARSVRLSPGLFAFVQSRVDSIGKRRGATNVRLFEDVEAKDVNAEIRRSVGPGVTAKDLRTRRACDTYRDALAVHSDPLTVSQARAVIECANARVAFLLNHKRYSGARGRRNAGGRIDGADDSEVGKLLQSARPLEAGGKKMVSDAISEAGLILSTSKYNYIDPRLTVDFCRRVRLDPEDVLSPSDCRSFHWAMG